MCFYYAINKKNPTGLIKNKVITEAQLKLFNEKYFINGFNFAKLPVITDDAPQEIQHFSWGLIPGWVKDEQQANELRRMTLNAKAETVFEKNSFRQAINQRRCLVLCSGFYEWQEHKGKKYPYFITLRDDDIFVFAGIWESWTDKVTGEVIKTFSILTTEANELMARIHNTKKRMPLILPHNKALDWLRKDMSEQEIASFFQSLDAKDMKAHTIRKILPAADNDYPEVTAYYPYPELRPLGEDEGKQLELF